MGRERRKQPLFCMNEDLIHRVPSHVAGRKAAGDYFIKTDISVSRVKQIG
jgi:hypothetical protein